MTYALPWRYSTTELKGPSWFNSRLSGMMAVEQVCPHRLVVQDISLSRRQRGFDFPWG
ncbi:unnamed protein product [Arabidopsis lyrata]|uniref:Uncharacterized protein n=1 Tax=Arabidopsis lyrata subsp. lyrata TaxID=81972 RepID=D7KRF6_ARALL|nr:hypothetical protein ARALYDRAFT_894017 [Arabidopsis lyrata subsp. lyrata]CAH8256953.1 unnamed protein product [Arabidopsis lyrata]